MHSHVYVYKFVYFIWFLGYIILTSICIQYDCGSLNSICLIVLHMSRVFPSHWSFWIDLCISRFCWMPKDATAKAKLRRDCFIVPKGEVPSEAGMRSNKTRSTFCMKNTVRVRSVNVMSDDDGGDDEDDDAFHVTQTSQVKFLHLFIGVKTALRSWFPSEISLGRTALLLALLDGLWTLLGVSLVPWVFAQIVSFCVLETLSLLRIGCSGFFDRLGSQGHGSQLCATWQWNASQKVVPVDCSQSREGYLTEQPRVDASFFFQPRIWGLSRPLEVVHWFVTTCRFISYLIHNLIQKDTAKWLNAWCESNWWNIVFQHFSFLKEYSYHPRPLD